MSKTKQQLYITHHNFLLISSNERSPVAFIFISRRCTMFSTKWPDSTGDIRKKEKFAKLKQKLCTVVYNFITFADCIIICLICKLYANYANYIFATCKLYNSC